MARERVAYSASARRCLKLGENGADKVSDDEHGEIKTKTQRESGNIYKSG